MTATSESINFLSVSFIFVSEQNTVSITHRASVAMTDNRLFFLPRQPLNLCVVTMTGWSSGQGENNLVICVLTFLTKSQHYDHNVKYDYHE